MKILKRVVFCMSIVAAQLMCTATQAQTSAPASNDEVFSEMYSEAMDLKRDGEFAEARRVLNKLIGAAPEGSEWRETAQDEFRYGIPLFEAQSLVTELGDPTHDVKRKLDLSKRAASRAQEVIDLNRTDAARVREAQKILDTLATIDRSLVNIKKATVISDASGLRVMLSEYYMDQGACIDEKTLRSALPRMKPEFRLLSALGSAADRTYRFEDPESRSSFQLRCGNGKISMQQ